MSDDIPQKIQYLLRTRGDSVFTIAEASTIGVSAGRIERLAKRGALTRVGRGVYASTAELADSDAWRVHRIRTRGYLLACGANTYAAGWSAVAIRDLRRLGTPPAFPTVVRATSASTGARHSHGSTHNSYGVTRNVRLTPRDLGQYAGWPVVDKAWLVVDLARITSRVDGLVVADSALASGATDDGLQRALTTINGWPGAANAAWVVDHADGRSESVLETLGRFCCIDYGLPVPRSNVWVGNGIPEYRVDHLWPWHGVAAEGDGAAKYNDAREPGRMVAAEKERQWFLERVLGLDVIRYDWDLAFRRPAELADRFARVLAANPVRSEPIPWWPIRSMHLPPERG